MPGMAISSWPSRKRASRSAHGPKMVRLPARIQATGPAGLAGARPRRNVTVSAARFRGYRPRPAPIRIARCAPPRRPRRSAPRPRSRPPPRSAPRRRRAGRAARRLAAARRQPGRRRRDPPGARAGTPTGGCPATPASRRAFDWSGSRNLAAVAYEWPRPTLFDSFGLPTIGYSGALVLPVRLTPEDPAAPLDARRSSALLRGLRRHLRPGDARLTARLAPDAPRRGPRRDRGGAGRARPHPRRGRRHRRHLRPGPGRRRLRDRPPRSRFAADPGPGQVAVLEAGQPDLWIGAAESRTEGRTVIARAPVEAAGAAGPVLERRACG